MIPDDLSTVPIKTHVVNGTRFLINAPFLNAAEMGLLLDSLEHIVEDADLKGATCVYCEPVIQKNCLVYRDGSRGVFITVRYWEGDRDTRLPGSGSSYQREDFYVEDGSTVVEHTHCSRFPGPDRPQYGTGRVGSGE